MDIVFLMTCHNRKEMTLESLRRLYNMEGIIDKKYKFKIILVDDGSKDGTYEAVRRNFKEVNIIKGDGSLFWAGGMRLAMKRGMHEQPNYYVWVNDDTMLYPNSLKILLQDEQTARKTTKKPSIITGCIVDPITKEVTYGGFVASCKVRSNGSIQEVEQMNGNFVVIPKEIVKEIGNIDDAFVHSLGDIDYGCRAQEKGYNVYLSRQIIGECSVNSQQGTWQDDTVPIIKRYKMMLSPKGVPIKSLIVFSKRNDGWKWPLCILKPFVNIAYTSIRYQIRRQINHSL